MITQIRVEITLPSGKVLDHLIGRGSTITEQTERVAGELALRHQSQEWRCYLVEAEQGVAA